MTTYIEFAARPQSFYALSEESDAAWEQVLRAANLWAPGEYWPDFEQYETCDPADEADLHINGAPCVNIGGGGGPNSGRMGEPTR